MALKLHWNRGESLRSMHTWFVQAKLGRNPTSQAPHHHIYTCPMTAYLCSGLLGSDHLSEGFLQEGTNACKETSMCLVFRSHQTVQQ